MELLVLPVSGGGYVNQLSSILDLCEIKYKPDVVLSSSGGNVCAYISSAADWNYHNIIRISQDMCKTMFSKPWSTIPVVSYIIAFFRGNAYDEGAGAKEFFNAHFNKETIDKYEIWTGAYNKDLQKATIFCNREKNKSIFKNSFCQTSICENCECIYLNKDINLIVDASVSSAAIPAVIPPKKIKGNNYVDGGVAGSSPLLMMKESIINYIRNNKKFLHLIYINPINFDKPKIFEGENIMVNWKQTFANIVNSQILTDCQIAYHLLLILNYEMNRIEFPSTAENLKQLKKIENYHYLLEFYPVEPNDINIVDFNGEEVGKNLIENKGNNICKLWAKSEALRMLNIKY